MALINKIREKSGIVIGIIALSLILFIVGGDLLGSRRLMGGNPQKVGEIAGHEILYDEFNRDVEQVKANYQNQGSPISEEMMPSIRNQVWEQMVLRYAYQDQYDKLGVRVSPKELEDMVQGNNISPAIKQIPIFTNEKTGQFDKNLVVQYLKNIASVPQQRAIWQQSEEGLVLDRMRNKYENLLTLSTYVTTQEAKREYEAQTTKASLKYLYVPYYSIIDSTIKVTDAQLEDYLSRHKDQYKGANTRSLQYVTFAVLPSAKDSADFLQELKDLAKGLATAENDTAFARANSDVEADQGYIGINQMSEPLRQTVSTFFKGGIYGPYQEGAVYAIYKMLDSKQDSIPSVRASHILIQAKKTDPDSVKTAARKKAEGLLAQLKSGANFEVLAQQNGSDGTASRGGDLGWYTKGSGFVKPFEDAILNAPGKGLIPHLVETEFGYHIIKITEPKTSQKYKFATIKKTMGPSDETQNEAYQKAGTFAAQSPTAEAFKENLKKDPSLVPFVAERIQEEASNVNSLRNAREVVRWAFGEDTDVNSVSPVFEVDNQYVVALLTGKSDKGKVSIADFRDELTNKVRNELKTEQILKKLGNASGSLDDIAKKYGPEAQVQSATDVNLASASLQNVGFDPIAVGKAFSLKKGARTKPFAGENGVVIIEMQDVTPAPAIADYGQYKNQLKQTYSSRTSLSVNEVIKDHAKIEDNRSKFY